MKRILSFVFLTLFGLQALVAQQEFYYGPKVGFNISHLMFSGNNSEFYKEMSGMKLATHIGGFMEIVLSESVSVQPELLYSVKGARFEENNDYESAFVFKYLTMPVVVKYYISERVTIEGGPYISYLLSAKNVEVNGIFSTNVGSEAAAIELKDDLKPLDAGMSLGLGYITKSGFYLSTRYEYGFLNPVKSYEKVQADFKNGNIMLSAGFSLNY